MYKVVYGIINKWRPIFLGHFDLSTYHAQRFLPSNVQFIWVILDLLPPTYTNQLCTFPDIVFIWILDTDDYARVALPTGLEETGQQAANAGDSSDVESVVEDDDAPGIEGMIGFADLL